MASDTEDLLRELAPQVLGALVRRYGQFDACEEAVQEALLAASQRWPVDGVPENPRSWLLTVANRRLIDTFRSESARRRREESDALMPSTITVKRGTTLELDNVSNTAHTFTVTGQNIDVETQPGQTSQVTIDLAPGTYPFICRFHQSLGMTGTLVVKA